MQRGDDKVVVVVLNGHKAAGQVVFVVVIHQREGARPGGVVVPALFNQCLADKVADCLLAVGVAFAFAQVVKRFQQVLIQ